MKGFMLRRPDFLEGASVSRYMPGPAAALGIGTLILFADVLFGIIVVAFFVAATLNAEALNAAGGLENIKAAYSQPLVLIILGIEGALVIFTMIHTRFIERRPLSTLGFVKRGFAKKFIAGFGIGAAPIAVCALPALLSPGITYTGFTPAAAAYFIVLALVGAGEETLFRGYVFTALLRRTGVLLSVVISSAFFTLFHIFNGYGAAEMLQVFLLGALFALLTLRTGAVWGAVGAHLSWNFVSGLLSPISVADFNIGYSVFSVDGTIDNDTLANLILSALLLAAIALLLFAGKGRLVVRKTRERQMFEKARKAAKRACEGISGANGKPFFMFVRRVAEAAKGEDAKAAAFLKYAIAFGAKPAKEDYDEEVLTAAESLAAAVQDGGWYEERASGNGIAPRVLEAQNAMRAVIEGYDLAGTRRGGELIACPMLGWNIKRHRCAYFAGIVDSEDSGYDKSPELPPEADRSKCRECGNRRT